MSIVSPITPTGNGVPETHANPTDLGNARRLVRHHGNDLHYCWPWGKWLHWTGKHWRIDNTGAVERLAKDTIAKMYVQAITLPQQQREALIKHAMETEKRVARIDAMIRSAQSEPGIHLLPGQLDNDQWALNTLNGTLDLRTGQLHSHRRDDLISKLCPVEYLADAQCPLWTATVTRVLGPLANYTQRLLGYGLTGSTREQMFSIWHGTGANGKSTILNTILHVLGHDYAMKAPSDLLMTQYGEPHPTRLADLHGKRLVCAVETEEGRRLCEPLVKELTGGDVIRARRMREDFWEFSPTHKLILATNHRPRIVGTDNGIWRRVKLLPFEVSIPPAEQDTELPEKLKGESAGILAWLVRGCLAWQRDGLNAPEEVMAATNAYRSTQDALGGFLDERCVQGPAYRCKASTLYAAYTAWCKATGETEITQRDFGQRISERGFERKKNNGIWYIGIQPRTDCETTERTEPHSG
jgi:putative DNA primase/helicase